MLENPMPFLVRPVKTYAEAGYSMYVAKTTLIKPAVSFRADYADGDIEASERQRASRRLKAGRYLYYTTPTPYQVHKAWDVPFGGAVSQPNSLDTLCGHSASPAYSHNDIDRNLNKARERFIEGTRSIVEAGESLFEGRKTIKSIDSILAPPLKFMTAMLGVRRGDVKPLVALLKRTNPNRKVGGDVWVNPKRWHQRRAFMERLRKEKNLIKDSDAVIANAWLELQYGLGPAIASVYDLATVLADSPPYGRVVGRATSALDLGTPVKSTGWNHTCTLVVKHHVQADVTLSSARVGTLEQFGVLNPAALAWELTPFSLVVDWFYNIGSWLRQFSELAGLELRNSFYSCKREARGTSSYTEIIDTADGPVRLVRGWDCKSISLERTVGFPAVTMVREPGLTFKRAANAVALVASIGHSALNQRANKR